MSAERVGAINLGTEAAAEAHEHWEPEGEAASPLHLKIAKRPVRNRVQRLLDLTDSLVRETNLLVRDQVFNEESLRLQTLNLAEGIDFYEVVQRFETSLIQLALNQTRGHQAQAAKLLHIKPTTLNSKIKLYGIEY